MKGLNVKRIAALTAGAVVLGASLAAADVMFGSTQIVNQNGQPVVKVVVGSKAAASDGVVAANIAAAIGNQAYSKQTMSATLSGTATCTATGSGGAGTCPVSDKKVTLEVTLPGVVSGSASFKTYINDYVDKYTEDRQTAPTGSGNNYSTTTEIKPCFTGTITSGNVNSTTSCEIIDPSSAGTNDHGRKITGGDFPALATATVRDTYGGKTYTEEQSLWVYGKTLYDETGKTIVSDKPNIAYKIDFTHDLYGLPEYTTSSYNPSSKVAGDKTDRHRVTIKFLGEDWIISELSTPDMAAFNPSAYVAKTVDSTSISLAKESAYGIVHIGENLTAGAYSIKLADIGLAEGTDNIHPAAIEIYDANGVLVKEDRVRDFNAAYSWTAPDGSKVKIRVYQTQPGYTLASKWAEMAVYSNQITLTHKTKLDNVDNPLWYPYLYWSNNPNNNNVTTLKTLILRRDPNDPSTVMLKLQKGDSVPVLTTPAKFQLTFDGINLGSSDYDALSVSITSATTLAYGTTDCNSPSNTASHNFVLISSGLSNAFTVNGAPVSSFYVDLGNITYTNSTYVYYQQSGMNCFFRQTISGSSTMATYNLGDGVTQSLIALYVYGGNGSVASSTGNFSFYLEEKASSTSDDKDRFLFEIDNSTDTAWAFTGSSTQSKIKYRPAVTTGPHYTDQLYKAVDPGYTSERGSVFLSLSSKASYIKVAKKIAEATYFVNTVGAAPSGATTITLAEGEEQTLAGGVQIKAKSITEKVGACTVGGGAGCKVDMTPVSAVLNTGEASKNVIVPYKVSNLVALDSDNPNAAVLIAVGGPVVNTVTAEALGGSSPLAKPGDMVVKEVGNKIVVAGYTAQDTVAAGNDFLSKLQVS